MTYFETRLKQTGLTDTSLMFQAWHPEAPQPSTIHLIQSDNQDNVVIPVFDINGYLRTYPIKKSDGSDNLYREETYAIKRLKSPLIDAKNRMVKYLLPKGRGTFPWVSPLLIKAYRDKTTLPTLIITEGYLKAICGYAHGLPIAGLSSITHHTGKDTRLHADLLELIKKCKVQNLIVLYDGDFADISQKALEESEDLYTRPQGFFNSIRSIREKLKDLINDTYAPIDLYFAAIKTSDIEGTPKGLDDLYNQMPNKAQEITDDLLSFSKTSAYFIREQVNASLNKVKALMCIDSAQNFYLKHAALIGEKKFKFLGTIWQFNSEKAHVEVIIPGEAKNYFRVGDDFYENVFVPNKHGEAEPQFHRRLKTTILSDYKKDFLDHIIKLKAFCNVPDHVNFQPVIQNCYNSYHPFVHEPLEGEFPVSMSFMKHIFQDHLELGLDYIQLLYTKPTQVLPILCLVSKENDTGKSTFAKWLKKIFTNNMAIVGNEELSNSFNSSYANKLIVCCEESFIDKKLVMEKIKALSTTDKIVMNTKFRAESEIDFFAKFILLSNNEDNFISASDEDIRYWIRKVPVVPQEQKRDIMQDLSDEIPAFLHFLSTRKFHTPYTGSRMFFRKEDIVTEALKKVVINSMPSLEKEIRTKLRTLFMDFGCDIILMSNRAISHHLLNNRHAESYVEKIMKDYIKATTYRNPEGKAISIRYGFPKHETVKNEDGRMITRAVIMKDLGRPYVLKAHMFLNPEELLELTPQMDLIQENAIEVGEYISQLSRLGIESKFQLQNELPF